MNEKIKAHVDSLFSQTSDTPQTHDVKEELLANLNDKYDDLVDSGKSGEEAFLLAIAGIGDIGSLLSDLSHSAAYDSETQAAERKTGSVIVSIGIALYVFSLAVFVLLAMLQLEQFGFVAMIAVCAVATGFVVFGVNKGKVLYTRTNDTFVEEYKEMVSEDDRRRKLKGAASSSLWTLLVVIYFAISFLTGKWSVTWILFVAGACLQQFLLYAMSGEKKKGLWHGMLWTGTCVVYFLVSFGFGAWVWSWLLFLAAAALEQLIRLVFLWKDDSQ